MKYKDYKQRLDKALSNWDINKEKHKHLLEWVEHLKEGE